MKDFTRGGWGYFTVWRKLSSALLVSENKINNRWAGFSECYWEVPRKPNPGGRPPSFLVETQDLGTLFWKRGLPERWSPRVYSGPSPPHYRRAVLQNDHETLPPCDFSGENPLNFLVLYRPDGHSRQPYRWVWKGQGQPFLCSLGRMAIRVGCKETRLRGVSGMITQQKLSVMEFCIRYCTNNFPGTIFFSHDLSAGIISYLPVL